MGAIATLAICLSAPPGAVSAQVRPQLEAPAAALHWGGSGGEWVEDFLLLPDGDLIVVGRTSSPDLPGVEHGFDPDFGASGPRSAEGDHSDGFVARLAADGSGARWASFVGGGAPDVTQGIARLADGDLVLVGTTRSEDFPLTEGAIDRVCDRGICEEDGGDAFVLRLSPDGDLRWSTLLGGASLDAAADVVVSADGRSLWIVGYTASPDFPVTHDGSGPHPSTGPSSKCGVTARLRVPCEDLFVARMAADGTDLAFASVHGGSRRDLARSAVLAPDGGLVVGGFTTSEDLEVTTRPQGRPPLSGRCAYMWHCADGLVLRVDPDQRVRFLTAFGGEGVERVDAIALDAAGEVLIAGSTSSEDLRWSAWPTGSPEGRLDSTAFSMDSVDSVGYVARLSGDGSRLLDLAALGGPHAGFDIGAVTGLAVAAEGTIFVSAAAEHPHRGGVAVLGLDPASWAIQWGRHLGFHTFSRSLLALDEGGRIVAAGTAYVEEREFAHFASPDVVTRRMHPSSFGAFGRLLDEQGEGLSGVEIAVDSATAAAPVPKVITASGPTGAWAVDGLNDGLWIARPQGRGLWSPQARHIGPSRVALHFQRRRGTVRIEPARLDGLAAGDTITLSLRVGHATAVTLTVSAPWPTDTELVAGSVEGGRALVVEPERRRLSAVIDLDAQGRGELRFALRLGEASANASRLGFTPCVAAADEPCVAVEPGWARRHTIHLPQVIVGSRDGIG
jgi:hypothetical protein